MISKSSASRPASSIDEPKDDIPTASTTDKASLEKPETKKRVLPETQNGQSNESAPEQTPSSSTISNSKRLKRNTEVESNEQMESKPEEEVKEFTDQQNQVLDPNEIPVIARQRANVSSEAQRLPEQIKRPGAFNFNPTKDSPHHTGQKMPFWYICNALLDIEKCEGKNSQTLIKEIIANVFRAAIVNNAEELVELFYFFVIRLAPEYEALETGVGHELVLKSVAKACGKTPKQIREQFQKEGDLGLVVASGKKTISTIGTFFKGQTTTKKPSLTFATVFQVFTKIAKMSGSSSVADKETAIVKLLQDGNNEEAKYIVRWLQKSLKTGAAEKTVIAALARAIVYTPPNLVLTKDQILNWKTQKGEGDFWDTVNRVEFAIKEAACEFPNYGEIIKKLLEVGVDTQALREACHMQIGIPLKPMLAKPTKGVQVVLKRFENMAFTCEYKYDGFRGQVHYWQTEVDGKPEKETHVRIYSRNLENMTQAYPDVCDFVKSFVRPDVKEFILDAELVAYDVKQDKILPFQLLTQRSRKNVKKEDLETIVCLHAFDILYLNGQPLLKKNFIDRRALLHSTFDVVQGRFHFAKYHDAESFEEIENFLNESIKDCCEGLMVKTLDMNATYEPAKRSFNWLKLKKDYLDTEMGDSLDLVVVGADYGVGKRTGLFGSYLLACWNEDLECLQTVCKCGSGLTDEMLEKTYNQMKELIIDNAPENLKYKEKNVNVWIAPMYVWEIKAADLSLSPIYFAARGEVEADKGIALRFPRFIRERQDKRPENATSSEQIVEFYKAQAAVNYNFADNDDFDF